MIHLRFFGHIKTSMGAEEMEVERDGLSVDALFGLLESSLTPSGNHGFTKFNTLLVLNDAEIFSAASQKDRRLADGDSVLLVPFSHGG